MQNTGIGVTLLLLNPTVWVFSSRDGLNGRGLYGIYLRFTWSELPVQS